MSGGLLCLLGVGVVARRFPELTAYTLRARAIADTGVEFCPMAPPIVPPSLPHRVVIVGGGFAGLYAARSLGSDPEVRVTLVDRRNFHLFQPLLYQVATGALSPGDIAQPLRSMLRKQRNTTVLLGEAVGIDPDRREVLLSDGGPLAYDTLIVATGARHTYFGHDEWARSRRA